MRKISYKFSHEGLTALMQFVELVSNRLKSSSKDFDRLTYCCLVQLQIRFSRQLMFQYDGRKRITFSMIEFIAIRVAYTSSLKTWGIYEEVIVSAFISEGGKKL